MNKIPENRENINKDHLVDGKYSLSDLVDMERLRHVFDNFSRSTNYAIGITSYPEQKTLLAVGWADICVKFHRGNSETNALCVKSNISMTSMLKKPGDVFVEKCENGLIDGGVAIIIKNTHIATLFAGQVFFKEPDLEWFRSRAFKFGFNADEYIDAVKAVPVVSEDKFRSSIKFLEEIALLIAQLGYERIEAMDKNVILTNEVSERVNAEKELAVRGSQLEILAKAGEKINRVLDTTVIMRELVACAIELVGAEMGAAGELTGDGIFFREYNNNGQILVLDYKAGSGFGVPGWVVNNIQPCTINDASIDERVDQYFKKKIGFNNLIGVPIISRNAEVLGCFEVYNKKEGKPFDHHDVTMLQGLASSAAIAMENARMLYDRKMSEDVLRRSEERYRGIYDIAPLAVIGWDRECRVTEWNKKAEQIFGWPYNEVVGRNFFDFLIPEDQRGGVGSVVGDLLNGHISNKFTNDNLTKDGRVISCEWYNSVQKDLNGNILGIISMGLDVTDRKMAEKALIVSEENYRSVFETANDGIVILDIETGSIIDVNNKACEMYLYPKDSLLKLGMKDLSLGKEPYSQADFDGVIKKAASGEAQLFEWMAKDRAERLFWVEVNLKRAVIGGKYRIVGIIRDITERKNSEERWAKIHQAFIAFGSDPDENINLLTALCGELLRADCVLYNRLEDGILKSCGRWNVPDGFVPIDRPEGHICYDIIRGDSESVEVMRDLQNTQYVSSDPNIAKYNLQTYVGKVVKLADERVGTLCAVYQYDFEPSEEDKEIMIFISLAISVEEERKSAEEMSRIAQFSITKSSDAIFWIGPDSDILHVNDMACSALGYSGEEIVGMTILGLDDKFFKDISWPYFWNDLKDKGSITFETILRKKDLTLYPVEVTMNYLEFKDSEYSFTSVRDISARKLQEEEIVRRDYQLEILSRTSQHINAVLDVPVILRTLTTAAIELVDAEEGMAGIERDGKIVFDEYCRNGKFEPLDYVCAISDGTCGCATKNIRTYMSNDVANDTNLRDEFRGKFACRNLVSVPILNRERKMLACLELHNKSGGKDFDAQDLFMLQGLAANAAVALDNANMLVQRNKAQMALTWQKSYYENLLSEANVWIEVIDRDANVALWNNKAEEISGYSSEIILGGQKKWELEYPDARERSAVIDFFKSLIASGKAIKDFETDITVSSGKKRTISWSSTIIRDSSGNIAGSMFIGDDVTERKSYERDRELLNKELVKSNKRLNQLALKDSETGLHNHHYLTEVIERELYRAKRYVHPLSVVMIDIDYFRSVNDLYGHEFGDMVLRQFALQLRKMVRRYDVVVRFGGEEFLVLSSGADRDKAISLAQRIVDTLSIYNFGDNKHAVKLKFSAAVASYPEDPVEKGMDLIYMAEKILDKVKEAGGNKVYSSLSIRKKPVQGMVIEPTNIKYLKSKISRLTKSGRQNLMQSIFAFAKTIEMRDHYTGEHADSTVHYSTQIARALNLDQEEIDRVRQAAILHDLGKVGISDKILLKKSRLSVKEFREIQKHPQIGADIIRPIQFMQDIIPLILHHHEHWDGGGYPDKLKGDVIPVGARIISIADVFQALTSDRPYRKAYSKNKAMKILKSQSGKQFDPDIVKVFIKILESEDDRRKPAVTGYKLNKKAKLKEKKK